MANSFDFMIGTGGRSRTDMTLRSPDFESGASTSFATSALMNMLSNDLEIVNPNLWGAVIILFAVGAPGHNSGYTGRQKYQPLP